MNRRMTVPTDGDRAIHLLATEAFLEPLVMVTTAWNQMMLGRTTLCHSPTQFAGPRRTQNFYHSARPQAS